MRFSFVLFCFHVSVSESPCVCIFSHLFSADWTHIYSAIQQNSITKLCVYTRTQVLLLLFFHFIVIVLLKFCFFFVSSMCATRNVHIHRHKTFRITLSIPVVCEKKILRVLIMRGPLIFHDE